MKNYMNPRQASITFAVAVLLIGMLIGTAFIALKKDRSVERKPNNIHYTNNG